MWRTQTMLTQCSNEEIVNELALQGVTNSVSIKSKDGTVSNTFILSFNTPTPPKIIKVGYLKNQSTYTFQIQLDAFSVRNSVMARGSAVVVLSAQDVARPDTLLTDVRKN